LEEKDYSVELFTSKMSGKKKVVVNGVTKMDGKM
jgi:hypothetical protein